VVQGQISWRRKVNANDQYWLSSGSKTIFFRLTEQKVQIWTMAANATGIFCCRRGGYLEQPLTKSTAPED